MKNLTIGLIIGFVVGLGVSAFCMKDRSHHRFRGGEHHTQFLLKRFSSKLDLSKEQETKVGAILEVKREKIEAIRSEMKPKFEEIRNSTREEIKKVLNPDQQKKFDVLDEKLRKRWKKR